MAIQTKPYVVISSHGAVRLEVHMEYHDDDFRVPSNDDGEPDDFRVVRWYGENHTDAPIRVQLVRGNGQHWQDVTIPANSVFSQDAGGAIKYESDIPTWRFG